MKELKKHVFIFNPKDNGGEQLILVTKFMEDGERILTEQSLNLQSYCNCASFELVGTQLKAKNLRQLANELDEVSNKVVVDSDLPIES